MKDLNVLKKTFHFLRTRSNFMSRDHDNFSVSYFLEIFEHSADANNKQEQENHIPYHYGGFSFGGGKTFDF